ncbi:hypothetical protein Nepgr_025116 [Nepenthes gracilis]|uniref:Glycosyltransferase n=1 Tax=Nepenthes gracilis TaxID=150966 RepID=A0AAD3T5K9_NEPGR|nr:hypothetical protein Nepgr_025116 [Nepenthes gracilis]
MTPPPTSGAPRRHVAVCAFPFATHAAPVLLLTRRIASAAPDVRFTFFNTDKSNAVLFKSAGGGSVPDNIVPHGVHDGVPEGYEFSGSPVEPVGLFLKAGEESLRKSIEEAEEQVGMKISCLVTDAFLWFCQKIAAEKGAPWVPVWTGGASSLASHLHTDLFRSKFGVQDEGLQGRDNEAADMIPGFSAVRVGDLPAGIVTGDLRSPFSQMLHEMAFRLPKAAAVAINSFEGLDPDITRCLSAKLRNFLNVGPFALMSPPPATKSDKHGCLPWLESQAPASVTYVSFGSVATPPPDMLVGLAEALEASKVAFLWSMNDNAQAKLPKGFVERTGGRGKVVPWAPQLALLAHPSVAAFVTHGGWNSILESIVSGVPMICLPFFGDQILNRRFIECVWRIGIGVEGEVFMKTGMLNALKKVMVGSEEGKKMRENLRVLKQLAQEAVKADGSSTQNFSSLMEIITAGKES